MLPNAPSQVHTRLRVFLAAARHLSFTRAGEELHITTGAVSQQIKLLEDWLGQRLFRRLPLTQLAMRGTVYGIFVSHHGGMQSVAVM